METRRRPLRLLLVLAVIAASLLALVPTSALAADKVVYADLSAPLCGSEWEWKVTELGTIAPPAKITVRWGNGTETDVAYKHTVDGIAYYVDTTHDASATVESAWMSIDSTWAGWFKLHYKPCAAPTSTPTSTPTNTPTKTPTSTPTTPPTMTPTMTPTTPLTPTPTSTPATTTMKVVYADLTPAVCGPAWKWVIHDLGGVAAPTKIHVRWGDGTETEVALDEVVDGTAYYVDTTHDESATVESAWMSIDSTWAGWFKLLEKACAESVPTATATSTPTSVPISTPTMTATAVPTNTPVATVLPSEGTKVPTSTPSVTVLPRTGGPGDGSFALIGLALALVGALAYRLASPEGSTGAEAKGDD